MTTPFQAQLIPSALAASNIGFGSSGSFNPNKWADELFQAEMPGPMLACYCLRRFGWPNEGSDPHKNFMTWTLTTPMKGIYLCITPYMGHQTGDEPAEIRHMHFGLRYPERMESKFAGDPGRDDFRARIEAAVREWWDTTGSKLYCTGWSIPGKDPNDILVQAAGTPKEDGTVYGLWKRLPSHDTKHAGLPSRKTDNYLLFIDWLRNFIRDHHPEADIPTQMTPEELAARESPFCKEVKAACQATLQDLLRPVSVRDISLTPFGDIERNPVAIQHYNENLEHVSEWAGVGHTPEYWYAKQRKLDEAKERRWKAKYQAQRAAQSATS